MISAKETWGMSRSKLLVLMINPPSSCVDIAQKRAAVLWSWQVAEPAINAIPITCFERARAKASKLTHPEKPGPAYLYGGLTCYYNFSLPKAPKNLDW